MTPGVYPDVVERARSHLAAALGCAPADIVVETVEPVVWNDGALGCPQPGVMYTQATVAGYKVTLTHDGQRYWYHTDRRRNVVPCPHDVRPLSGAI